MAKPTNYGRRGSTYGFLREMRDTGYRNAPGKVVRKRTDSGRITVKRTDQRIVRKTDMPRVADEATEARLSRNIRHKIW